MLCHIPVLSESYRHNPPEVFLGKRCSENMQQIFTRTLMLSIKLLCDFIEITLWHVFSPVSLLHIFRRHLYKYTYGELLLILSCYSHLEKNTILLAKNCYKISSLILSINFTFLTLSLNFTLFR